MESEKVLRRTSTLISHLQDEKKNNLRSDCTNPKLILNKPTHSNRRIKGIKYLLIIHFIEMEKKLKYLHQSSHKMLISSFN